MTWLFLFEMLVCDCGFLMFYEKPNNSLPYCADNVKKYVIWRLCQLF